MYTDILARYKNGNYSVIILKDGTKIRLQKDDILPFIPSFPESMDITITEKCNENCRYCYANCTPDGKHAELFKYNFINEIKPFTEVAINGNDLDHPQLTDFLKFMKEKQVIVNITVNQNQFMDNLDLLEKLQSQRLLYGIGISFLTPENAFLYEITSGRIKNIVVHVIAGILGETGLKFLAREKNIKLLILGYKNKGRGVNFKNHMDTKIQQNIMMLEDNYNYLINNFCCVSFDNLALEQLHIKNKLTSEQWESYYMGDEGSITFFIDMVNGRFARSSMDTESFPITKEMDSINKMFKFIRDKYDGKIEGENIL